MAGRDRKVRSIISIDFPKNRFWNIIIADSGVGFGLRTIVTGRRLLPTKPDLLGGSEIRSGGEHFARWNRARGAVQRRNQTVPAGGV